MSTDNIIRLINLAKEAPDQSDRLRALAEHFSDMADRVKSGVIVAEEIRLGQQRQIVEDVFRPFLTWHDEVVRCSGGISLSEKEQVLKAVRCEGECKAMHNSGAPENSLDPLDPVD